ncbi:MAG: sulfatase-like hydrolase/transferase [candidate division Zixibacteria bacterium]|nr:sulfatase-like hydrolase/transferase [candidate division Zixibacteria bacterium]
MNKGFSKLASNAALASILAALLVGIIEALLLFATIGNYADFLVFKYAVLLYGMLGVAAALGAILSWLLLSKLVKELSSKTVYWLTLTFISGVGIHGLFQYLWITIWSLPSPLPSNKLGLLIWTTIFVVVFFPLCRWLDTKSGSRLSGRSLNLLLVILLFAVPLLLSVVLETEKDYKIKGKHHPLTDSKPNIYLIVADALRADYLQFYGGETTTPALQSLKNDGILFERAYAPCSWTRPSFASLLTGVYSNRHGVREFLTGKFSDEIPSLQQYLADIGYYTCGFFNNANLSPDFKFQIGFDEYYYFFPTDKAGPSGAAVYLRLRQWLKGYGLLPKSEYYHPSQYYKPAEELIPSLQEWIKVNQNFSHFAILHLMEPHGPYFPHPYNGKAYGKAINPDAGQVDILFWNDIYREEVVHMDSCLSEFFTSLKQEGLYDSSLIIFTSDHGEEFYDHQYMNHGTTLYEEVIWIPLIVKLPGNHRDTSSIESLVSLIDIPSTIAGILDIDPPDDWDGIDMISKLTDREHRFADLKNDELDLYSVVTNDYKLIHNLSNPKNVAEFELYSLIEDSEEKRNIADRYPRIVDSLNALIQLELMQDQISGSSDTLNLDKATIERLKALGYLE